MITTESASAALDAADHVAETLADPSRVWSGGRPPGGRSWPQSLAGGEAGITLLHIERARSGRGEWSTAHAWLAASVQGEVSAASNANLYFGAPALAFVTHLAHSGTGRYGGLLARLDEATLTVTRNHLAAAHARIDRAERVPMAEFDLIRGLSGLASYHLSRHPDHQITRDVLSYLVRLTCPLTDGDALPPWWTSVAPNGEPSSEYPQGHGNVGLSHGIGSALSVMSLALLRGVAVPGTAEAVARICAWTDRWRQGDETGPWWPGLISIEQAADGRIDPALRPRPSWCYGVSGTAPAQQLAGLALGDPARVQVAENAILAALRDQEQFDRVPEIGLCHGTAGLLHAAWRMADQTNSPAIIAELPRVADRLIVALDQPDHDPELLDGAAGAALALHIVGTGIATAPHWDAVLALA
ncbi:lanthionine synthetase C family protein [Actinacidiphila acididurans]|uniref:lanthionine synthetase C family protein n=1 Tax=Actinacidiphila acididurans TaxID=2784346 RepID=UPI0027DCDB3E|nr:lanthionine synthetase C family protein [Actinacidiphila acididurans]